MTTDAEESEADEDGIGDPTLLGKLHSKGKKELHKYKHAVYLFEIEFIECSGPHESQSIE